MVERLDRGGSLSFEELERTRKILECEIPHEEDEWNSGDSKLKNNNKLQNECMGIEKKIFMF
jgi:hypothetical protein